jgi:cobalamin-dependent methionine synthase I
MEPVILEGFEIEPDEGELSRLLGRKNGGGEAAPEKFADALAAAREESEKLILPKAIYVTAAGSALQGTDRFAELERMAFCVCTIGPALEERVTGYSAGGDMLPAVILDAIGSAAAEAVARYANDRIEETAAAEGLKTSCRASPGYGDWDVSGQRALFELVPAERIGVTLTASAMMVPRKSVSFAVHISNDPVRLRSENSCRNCRMENCPYRILE